jgi:hypothetical protein
MARLGSGGITGHAREGALPSIKQHSRCNLQSEPNGFTPATEREALAPDSQLSLQFKMEPIGSIPKTEALAPDSQLSLQ